MTEETRISKEIERYAQKNRIWQLARYQAQTNLNGLPDRLFLYKGILIGVEVKTPKGKATELQIKKLRTILENGGIGVLIDDVKKFEKLIKDLDYQLGWLDPNENFLTDSQGNYQSLEYWQKWLEDY